MYVNAISFYRFGRLSRRLRLLPLQRIAEALNLVAFSASIPARAEIGEGTVCEHRGIGVVVHPGAVIGRRCRILPHAVVGGRGGDGRTGAPRIGDDVLIGTGAKILGPVQVGDGARVGANAVVIEDVPAGATAVGIPARVTAVAGQ
jgi:serine O-acetyltransferase